MSPVSKSLDLMIRRGQNKPIGDVTEAEPGG
jgi:hypothetical protein